MKEKDKKKADIESIIKKIKALSPGDLFGIYDVVELLNGYSNKIPEDSVDVINFFGLISKEMNELLNLGIKDSIVNILYTIVEDNKPKINLEIQSFNKRLSEIKDSDEDIVDDSYFESIVDDREMMLKFFDEANDHLNNAQFSLLDLEYDSTNKENINRVFRAFHTIKSSSAFLGIKNIEDVSHHVENMLALVRDGELKISSDLIDVIFYSIGFIKDLINVITINDCDVKKIISDYKTIKISNTIRIIKNIVSNYKNRKIGEILEDMGKIDENLVKKIIKRQKDENKKFGEIALEEKAITQEDLSEALKIQINGKTKTSYVRVSSDRLNFLVDMVGELVVTQSMIKANSKDNANTLIERDIVQLESITTNIKNIVLSMGMVPIAEVFNKLRISIRNTSRELNKTVDCELYGEETELDRNIIETIYDPLVHIVRNSVSHGIEQSDEREKYGKPRIGKIKISALHKGNGIEISVHDDGKGLNKEKILEKALHQKLITEEDVKNLPDKEVFKFIFLPGFSTATEINEISGRGVGLDVVKKNIEQIHGKVDIVTDLGKGTTFVIKLPLTLAIIDGFVTLINKEKYIFAFNLIDEIIVPDENCVTKLDDGNLMLYNRNEYIPVIHAESLILNQTIQNYTENRQDKIDENIVIIVITYEQKRYGIIVDEVIGKQEIVIKNLNEALSGLKLFSGGTIFGDGSIGFVIDIEEFMQKAINISEKKV